MGWVGVWGFWASPGLVWMVCVVFAAALLWGGSLLDRRERRKRNEGPRAEPEGGAEACAGGNSRPRWRAADTEVCARGGGGAVGKTDNHTGAISVENAQDGRQGQGRRRRSAPRGRDVQHAGRGTTAHASAGTGNRGTAAGGQGPNTNNCTSGRAPNQHKQQTRQASEHQRIRRLGGTQPYDTWHSLVHLDQAQIQQGERRQRQDTIRVTSPEKQQYFRQRQALC